MRREVAALQPLHDCRIAVDLVARRNCRRIRRERRASARPLQIGNGAHNGRSKNHKGGGGGLAGVGCLAMQLLGYAKEPEVANALRVMTDWAPTLVKMLCEDPALRYANAAALPAPKGK